MIRLIAITPDAEKLIAYCARVSNPAGQDNPDISKLLAYCKRKQHWSIFEMANAIIEVKTSRAITAQILRHRSFSFQEFSQRYAAVQSVEPIELRAQDSKNRQSSHDTLSGKAELLEFIEEHNQRTQSLYLRLLEDGVAKECARMVLPMASSSTIYMNGTIRSWIHYCDLRCGEGTQLEHRRIAIAIRELLSKELPLIFGAL